MLAAALPTLHHAASAAASPNLGALPDPYNAIGHGNATSGHPASYDLTAQQVHDIQEATKFLPENVTSFYTRGYNPTTDFVPQQGEAYSTGDHTGAHAKDPSTPLINSSDIFKDSVRFLQSQGGSTSPAALLATQAQIIDVTLQLSLCGQIASKATSGVQTLMNNQV